MLEILTLSKSFNIGEDELFTILAHPIRRQLLTLMFENRHVSFSNMRDLGIATGTLYHHLKYLGPLIYQDENKFYLLNEEGENVCKWFIGNENHITVRKIDAFTRISYPINNFIEENELLILFFGLVMVISGQLIANNLDLVIFGSLFIFPGVENLIILNLLSLLGVIMLYVFSVFLVFKRVELRSIVVAIISLIPSYLAMIILGIISIITGLGAISSVIWFIISVLSQFAFLSLNSAFLVNYYGLKIERSILIVIVNLYLQLIIAFMISVI